MLLNVPTWHAHTSLLKGDLSYWSGNSLYIHITASAQVAAECKPPIYKVASIMYAPAQTSD